jgi:hypothetical protein
MRPSLTSLSSIARLDSPTFVARTRAPGRERFVRLETRLWVMAVVEFGEPSAIVVTVFSSRPPAVLSDALRHGSRSRF